MLDWLIRNITGTGKRHEPSGQRREGRRCIKCGQIEYFSVMTLDYDAIHDLLKVTCPRCGYRWNEDTADKAKPTPPPNEWRLKA